MMTLISSKNRRYLWPETSELLESELTSLDPEDMKRYRTWCTGRLNGWDDEEDRAVGQSVYRVSTATMRKIIVNKGLVDGDFQTAVELALENFITARAQGEVQDDAYHGECLHQLLLALLVITTAS